MVSTANFSFDRMPDGTDQFEPVRIFVCEAFSMTTRSINATQDEDHSGGQGGAAAVLG